jgi:hydrocephalus-inducing protein
MSASIPYAFELKTAAVCLTGLHLPQLLHPSAALPPQFEVLSGLDSSVEDARTAAEAAAAAVVEATAAAAAAAAAAAGEGSGDAGTRAAGKAAPAATAEAAAAAAAISDSVEVQGEENVLHRPR